MEQIAPASKAANIGRETAACDAKLRCAGMHRPSTKTKHEVTRAVLATCPPLTPPRHRRRGGDNPAELCRGFPLPTNTTVCARDSSVSGALFGCRRRRCPPPPPRPAAACRRDARLSSSARLAARMASSEWRVDTPPTSNSECGPSMLRKLGRWPAAVLHFRHIFTRRRRRGGEGGRKKCRTRKRCAYDEYINSRRPPTHFFSVLRVRIRCSTSAAYWPSAV